MPKEWILNIAINRWGLQKKNKVGAVSEEIRRCSPKTLEEWEKYYFQKIHPKEYLEEIGKKLYIKISEVMKAEIDEITEEDCIKYVIELVINKTYEGYVTEKKTIYEQLESELKVKIKPAPDEWDRTYNVDFLIEVDNKYIGIQIKPITFEHAPQYIQKWGKVHSLTEQKFMKKHGGKVFYIYSIKDGNKRKIYNSEVIEEIKQEIEKLKRQ
ncbi:MAG: MjaI family restriction endonuclease [Candidatus Hydrogenedentes bacterium]|nr:MjaI family restriction endonuclease [Candidatus Hydrogenedentota bacterium]